jgi:hypothetical protein
MVRFSEEAPSSTWLSQPDNNSSLFDDASSAVYGCETTALDRQSTRRSSLVWRTLLTPLRACLRQRSLPEPLGDPLAALLTRAAYAAPARNILLQWPHDTHTLLARPARCSSYGDQPPWTKALNKSARGLSPPLAQGCTALACARAQHQRHTAGS